MRIRTTLLAGLAFAWCSFGAAANTLTFQGVTFNTTNDGNNTLHLQISNANAATDNWTGVSLLAAFELGRNRRHLDDCHSRPRHERACGGDTRLQPFTKRCGLFRWKSFFHYLRRFQPIFDT